MFEETMKSIHSLIYYSFIVFFPNSSYLSLIILDAEVTEMNELKSATAELTDVRSGWKNRAQDLQGPFHHDETLERLY